MNFLKSSLRFLKVNLVPVLLSGLILVSCTDEKKNKEKPYPIETAKMVAGVTSGLISSNDPVRVIFVTDMADAAQTGQTLRKPVFRFDPSIDGTTRWENRRTLIFVPNRPLPFRESYHGSLDLKALFPEYKDEPLDPLPISFQVAGREISDFHGDLDLKNEGDPDFLVYSGRVIFSEATGLKEVEEAAVLNLDKRSILLEWSGSEDGKQFQFRSQPFRRTNRDQKLLFKINKDDLQISFDFDQNIPVPPLRELKVTDIIRSSGGTQPDLKIEFSDALKSDQDIRGLVSFKPDLDMDLKILDRTIFVQAPFAFGQTYQLTIRPGIRSRWATSLKEDFHETIQFEDMLPEMKFGNDGVFLPSSNNKKIRFLTVNIRRVQLRILKVFDSNLGQFLQMENLNGSAERRDDFNYNIDRVGLEVVNQKLEIGETGNKWLQHEIDLHKLIAGDEKGLYLVEITFEKEDMIYDTSEENLQYRRRSRDYYNDPSSPGYLWYHGRIYKPIICSDIGLIYKQGNKQHTVYATNVLSGLPEGGVHIRLMTYQNQLIGEGSTNGEGIARFDDIDQKVFYVESEKEGQRSVVKPDEMAWNLSTFDTGGEMAPDAGIRAFIYTDRGVHRPGDTIYLSAIIRNEKNSFPENHPLTLKVINPKAQTIYEQVNRAGVDGFYTFQFSTKEDDLTGQYTAILTAGSQTFRHPLSIETVVPERLKITLDTAKPQIEYNDKKIQINLNSTYLFGNPAAGLEAELQISLNSWQKSFKKYSDYSFTNQTGQFQTVTFSVFKNKLDSDGNAKIDWDLPVLTGVPSAVRASIKAEVWEKGGRSSKDHLLIDIDPYPYFVGLKRPDLKYWYAQTGQKIQIPVIVLTPDGKEAAGRTLNYKIYRNETNWWWEYDSREQYRLRYKNASSTTVVNEGALVSGSTPAMLSFFPQEKGEYLIEVRDSGPGGHTAAFFISAYPWGETPAAGKDAGILAIKTDKDKYNPGDEALISFPVPQQSTILFTLEMADRVIDSRWYKSEEGEQEKVIRLPVTSEMLPTVYASVAVLQPHAQMINDRPIRMYGVVPINVEEKATHQEIKLICADEFSPEKEFQVEIQTDDRKRTQFTIAIIDEGLLSLTHFKTPDAWEAFFRKQGLGVISSDLFNQMIGVNRGDIFRTFSVGGGMEAETYREGQLEQEKAKRFNAVVMFKGPLMTNDQGNANLKFKMPNYIGAVRVMVVSASGNRYGNAERTVPVTSGLMVLPTVPRVIGPNDKIILPVTLFVLKDNLGKVNVELDLEGPLRHRGDSVKTTQIVKAGERDVYFEIAAEPAVGIARIRLHARSARLNSHYETELAVRSSAPRISEQITRSIDPGNNISIVLPDEGLEGSNRATLNIQRRPDIRLTHRILWLIRYPYGCIEQTISAVFPQLYLTEFIPKSREAKQDIDKNINGAISRLRKFQMSSGGFIYWPGGNHISDWGTSYAGHFLIEAQKLGYNVPADMMKSWVQYQKSQTYRSEKNLMIQVYRNYTLALAGESSFSGMNILLENQLNSLNDVQKWLLAAGYELSGADRAADRVLTSTDVTVEDYLEFGDTYGSTLRDKSIILDQLVFFKRWNEAQLLASEIATALSSNDWYSTQTTAFMLMALGKYFRANEGDQEKPPLMAGKIILPDQREIPFETEEINFQVEVDSGFGETIQVLLDNRSTVQHAFVNLEWSGLPLRHPGHDESYNLTLQVEWLDDNGMRLDPSNLRQGQIFWAHFRAAKLPRYEGKIEELALVQVLPAGWEIDNIRLSGENLPGWTQRWKLNGEEYADIRDDRIVWFFDLDGSNPALDFLVKLSPVTVGEFILPPTLLEAMYNHNYRASKAGMKVKVIPR